MPVHDIDWDFWYNTIRSTDPRAKERAASVQAIAVRVRGSEKGNLLLTETGNLIAELEELLAKVREGPELTVEGDPGEYSIYNAVNMLLPAVYPLSASLAYTVGTLYSEVGLFYRVPLIDSYRKPLISGLIALIEAFKKSSQLLVLVELDWEAARFPFQDKEANINWVEATSEEELAETLDWNNLGFNFSYWCESLLETRDFKTKLLCVVDPGRSRKKTKNIAWKPIDIAQYNSIDLDNLIPRTAPQEWVQQAG